MILENHCTIVGQIKTKTKKIKILEKKKSIQNKTEKNVFLFLLMVIGDFHVFCAKQLTGCFKLSTGAKAQAATALLSLLKGLQGEIAARDELYVVSWVQVCF